MENAKALEIVKRSHEIRVNAHKRLFNGDIRADAREEIEAEKLAIKALEKQVAKPCKVSRKGGYYCPDCDKQQRVTLKFLNEGTFCDRCGQRVTPSDVGGAEPVSTTEFVLEIG